MMSHSPTPEYSRPVAKRPHPGVPSPDHYSPYAYPHPSHLHPQRSDSPPYHSISHDLYHHSPHRENSYYYAYHPYARPPKPSAYVHHPPLPHPPAPPAPPSLHRPRDPRTHCSRGTPRSSPAPAVKYYRPHARYDAQRVPPRPPPSSWDHTRPPPHTHEAEASLTQSQPRSQSGSTGSRWDSEVLEETPSPLDPVRTRQWEEQCPQALSSRVSSGPGSYREDDGTEYEVIDPALRDHSQSYYSTSSRGYDVDGSPVDEASLDGNSAGDADFEPGDSEIDQLNSQKRPNSDYYPSPHHQAQFSSMAREKGDDQQSQIGLNSLADGEPGGRPAYPIPTIIKCAILGSPDEKLTLSELYTAMEERFPYYKTSDKKSWRNSVRHNLSLNNQFDKKPRPMTEPGKGHYWVVIPGMPQGNKRERKRNKKLGKRALAALAAEEARQAPEQQPEKVANNTNNRHSGNNTNKDGADENGDKEASGRIPVLYPQGHVTATLPAIAGSYAAVTGAALVPAVGTLLYRPWNGDRSSLSIGNGTSLSASSISSLTVSTSSGSASQSDTDALLPTTIIPQAETRESDSPPDTDHPATSLPSEPSSHSTVPTSPKRSLRTDFCPPVSLPVEKSATASGVQRSVKSRDTRRYRPIAVASIPTSPSTSRKSAFETLAAQIQREGIGASGSGGPGSRTRGRRRLADRRGRRRGRVAVDDEDDDNDDDVETEGESILSGSEGRLLNRSGRR